MTSRHQRLPHALIDARLRDSRYGFKCAAKNATTAVRAAAASLGVGHILDDSATSTVGKLIVELARSILRVEAVGRAFVVAHGCPFARRSRPRCNERVTGVLVVLVIVINVTARRRR